MFWTDGRHKTRRGHRLIEEHEAELRRLAVEHLYLFGSTARDAAREDPDVQPLRLAELSSFDALIGELHHREQDRYAERLRGLEVREQFEFYGLLYRQIARSALLLPKRITR
jgi:hypothetical protein